jgi:hypothetical protein
MVSNRFEYPMGTALFDAWAEETRTTRNAMVINESKVMV